MNITAYKKKEEKVPTLSALSAPRQSERTSQETRAKKDEQPKNDRSPKTENLLIKKNLTLSLLVERASSVSSRVIGFPL